MAFAYLSPSWFFGYDMALELAFAIILLAVSLFAFKIYKTSSQKQVKLFGISFLFIAVSYFIQSIFNLLTISRMNEAVCQVIKMQSVILFDTLGIYAHMLFMTIGLVILMYMTFKTNNKKILWVLLIISLLTIFASKNTLYIFFLLSTIYLAFISIHFIQNYRKNKQAKTLLTVIAFLFLLFGSIHFMFSVNHQLFYAMGHILELVAYLLILSNLYLVRKK